MVMRMYTDDLLEAAERALTKAARAGAANPNRPHTIGGLRAAARELLEELDGLNIQRQNTLRTVLADWLTLLTNEDLEPPGPWTADMTKPMQLPSGEWYSDVWIDAGPRDSEDHRQIVLGGDEATLADAQFFAGARQAAELLAAYLGLPQRPATACETCHIGEHQDCQQPKAEHPGRPCCCPFEPGQFTGGPPTGARSEALDTLHQLLAITADALDAREYDRWGERLRVALKVFGVTEHELEEAEVR